MQGPRYTDLVATLPSTVPFVGPETQERSRQAPFQARLGANENLFGPSPRAVKALSDTAAEVWKYPDPENHDLIHALAAHHGVSPKNITIGEGIDGLLGVLVRLLIGAGDRVVTSAGAYPTFNFHVAGCGGDLHQVPFCGNGEDPDALIAKAQEVGAKLIYFSNPNNPMGSVHSAEIVKRMITSVPDGCLLVLDEAYIELAPYGTAPALDTGDARVIRMRTFSKAYGLAGLRVGYAMGDTRLISGFDKVRNHFGVGRLSQIGALAALQDGAYLDHVREQISISRQRLADIASAHGLRALPSATNFVTMDCGQDGDFARAVLAALLDAGIFVRMPGIAPLDRCIRVSCGPEDMMVAFEQALPHALDQARAASGGATGL